MDARIVTALGGLVLGLVASLLVWYYTGILAVFVLLPFVPFLFWRLGETNRRDRSDTHRSVRECPTCDFRTRDPEYEYCPRHGRRLR